MPILESLLSADSAEFELNKANMESALNELRTLEQRTRDASAKAAPSFAKRGQLRFCLATV
jgi:geranyl-CoA carboxylase beta subunit